VIVIVDWGEQLTLTLVESEIQPSVSDKKNLAIVMNTRNPGVQMYEK
jgi:hypothetical protein